MERNGRITTLITVFLIVFSIMLSVVACSSSENTDSDSPSNEKGNSNSSSNEESNKSNGSNETDGDNESGEPAEISIMISGDNTPSTDNIVLKELGERTNTIINMTYVPVDDITTKKSTMAATNDLPDIFSTGGSEALEFKEGGLLAEVGDLVNQYAPNIIDNVGENLPKAQVNDDGIYLILNARLGYVDQLNLRTDWLDNLNMEMPTDLDSLYDVFYAFTHNDPDGNGQDDTYGLAADVNPAAYATIFGAYGIPAKQSIELEDGSVTTWVKDPKFLDAMTYINKLNRDGLIEPDWATIPRMDMFGKLWNGVAGAIEWECVGPTNNWMPSRYTEDPPPTFDFPIIKGPDGSFGTPAAMPDLKSGYAFSSNCENLEAAVKLANFCMSDEGSELLYLGVEDVMFSWTNKENGEYEFLDEYKDDATHRAAGGFCYWWLFAPTDHAEVRTFNKQTREGVELARKNGIEYVDIIKTLDATTEYGSDMDQVINEMFVELLAADGDLEPIYDDYIAEWEEVGGSEWEIEATEAWKEQEGK